jgi:hypothetical protein
MAGVIGSAGFASGDRIVVGRWWESPIGAFTDVMWAEPDGVRVLYAPDDRVARFVTSIYRFDRLAVLPFSTEGDDRSLAVAFGDRRIELEAGRGVPIPLRRPRWFTRWIEGPIARLIGVDVYGTSPTGVKEWYQADVWRPVRRAVATVRGHDLGAFGAVDPPCGFGFSEPTRRPSIVALRVTLVDPSNRLASVVGRSTDPGPVPDGPPTG